MSSINMAELFDAYKKEEATVLDPGTYELEVIRTKVKHAGKGPSIMPIFRVHSGPHAGATVLAGCLLIR